MNRTLGDILKKFVQDETHWDRHLGAAEIAYNSAITPATGMSPYYCDLGYYPRVPADFLNPSQISPDTPCPAVNEWVEHLTRLITAARENIALAQSRMADQANRSRMAHPFVVGQEVLLSAEHLQPEKGSTRKFRSRWLGPFRITAAVGPVSFRLKLPPIMSRICDVFHASLLRPYHRSPATYRGRPYARPPPLLQPDGSEEWVVADITSRRTTDDTPTRIEYLVKWKGYPDEEATWEPLDHLEHCMSLVRAYDRAHPGEGARPTRRPRRRQ
jgi:hypothetical protein